jgi:hypothetical protein
MTDVVALELEAGSALLAEQLQRVLDLGEGVREKEPTLPSTYGFSQS